MIVASQSDGCMYPNPRAGARALDLDTRHELEPPLAGQVQGGALTLGSGVKLVGSSSTGAASFAVLSAALLASLFFATACIMRCRSIGAPPNAHVHDIACLIGTRKIGYRV